VTAIHEVCHHALLFRSESIQEYRNCAKKLARLLLATSANTTPQVLSTQRMMIVKAQRSKRVAVVYRYIVSAAENCQNIHHRSFIFLSRVFLQQQCQDATLRKKHLTATTDKPASVEQRQHC